MAQDNDKLREHQYDGIKELDNDLPKWWVYIFYITIVFAVIYMGYYHFGGPGKTAFETFDAEQQMEKYSQPAKPPTDNLYSEDKLNEAKSNKGILAKGADSFKTRCVACHGAAGEGGIGPNLTDDYWIHGGKITQVAMTIHNGVPEKGMVAWGALLGDDEIVSLAVYVKSLKGTNPPKAKAPQGNLEKD